MVTIRRATSDDLEAVVQLRVQLLREIGDLKNDEDGRALVKALRRYLSDKIPKNDFIAWVAEEKATIVAASGLIVFEKPPYAGNLAGVEGYVLNMFTLPAWRGKGIATELLAKLIRFAKKAGAKRLWLHATPAGRSIYEKAGFLPSSATSRHTASLEMERLL